MRACIIRGHGWAYTFLTWLTIMRCAASPWTAPRGSGPAADAGVGGFRTRLWGAPHATTSTQRHVRGLPQTLPQQPRQRGAVPTHCAAVLRTYTSANFAGARAGGLGGADSRTHNESPSPALVQVTTQSTRPGPAGRRPLHQHAHLGRACDHPRHGDMAVTLHRHGRIHAGELSKARRPAWPARRAVLRTEGSWMGLQTSAQGRGVQWACCIGLAFDGRHGGTKLGLWTGCPALLTRWSNTLHSSGA